jgi:hypothetical protein
MKTSVITITPKIAAEMLERNKNNRRLRPPIIQEYTRQMLAGLWKEETGEAIKVDYNGNIIDGQHRLHAIIKSSSTLSFLLITDLDPEIFSVLDTGLNRTASDTVQNAGHLNANNIAAAVRKYFLIKAERYANRTGAKYSGISNREILAAYNKNEKFWIAANSMCEKWYRDSNRILTLSEITALYAAFYDINQDDAFSFMDSLSTGVNLEQDNPIRLLREKLFFAKMNTRFSMIASVKMALVFKAWNFFRDKKTCKILSYNVEKEEFPTPR